MLIISMKAVNNNNIVIVTYSILELSMQNDNHQNVNVSMCKYVITSPSFLFSALTVFTSFGVCM